MGAVSHGASLRERGAAVGPFGMIWSHSCVGVRVCVCAREAVDGHT